ncbi:MAG: menaquinone biosynthesis protein [Bacteroidetes bacterium]|nr:menaquinone biosynthesis protein [Bacteroidota bacterium]
MLFLCRAKLIQLKKIKIGAVTYLNTKPLIYGMQQESFLKDHELILSYPARLAEMLKKGELDVALVPVAILPELPEYHIVSDYCIASDFEVASVCLFSEKPLSEIKKVYLDYQSRTSVALLKILFKEHWKQEVEWLAATNESYIDKIQGDTAGLIIGDRALQFHDRFAYRHDLATAWRAMTGLPFVFAVWVSLREMDKEWIDLFNQVNQLGQQFIETIIQLQAYPHFDLGKYYKNCIAYRLTPDYLKGMGLFLNWYKQFMKD